MSVIIRGKNRRKPHTVRFWIDGRQRERSFVTAREARDYQIKIDHDLRARIFIDDSRETFGECATTYLARLPIAPRSRSTYGDLWRKHIEPELADRAIASVARDRDAVTRLLTAGTLGKLSASKRRAARRIITGTLDEAVKAGKISGHRCDGIELGARTEEAREFSRGDFVFPSHDQVAQIADRCGTYIWLMRGCGLRIGEALSIEKADFREAGRVLRVSGQASRDGRGKVPLKHRRAGEYRDVPVPTWLWEMVRDLPDGPIRPGFAGRPYKAYRTEQKKFHDEARKAGIPSGFSPHSLRHAYVSALLAAGVPITDVALWLGHRSIAVTFSTYGHLVPSASARAVAALDAEYAAWTREPN